MEESGRGARIRSQRRRRRRTRLRILAATILAAAAVTGVALAKQDVTGRQRSFPTAGTGEVVQAARPTQTPTPPADTSPRWEAFAEAGGVKLYLPAGNFVAVTYHEASFHDALALHPLGHVAHDYNTWKFKPPKRSTLGPSYIVMSSRGRSTPATSAADVVLRKTTPVDSPVTGTVVRVRPYKLYCRYPDLEVKIRTADVPRLSVEMIHLRGVRVRPGDRVFATLSVIGYPRVFPFRSQVDDYIRGGNPHVHIEITRPHQARLATC